MSRFRLRFPKNIPMSDAAPSVVVLLRVRLVVLVSHSGELGPRYRCVALGCVALRCVALRCVAFAAMTHIFVHAVISSTFDNSKSYRQVFYTTT